MESGLLILFYFVVGAFVVWLVVSEKTREKTKRKQAAQDLWRTRQM
jgi:hypothetical protein